MAFYIFIPLMEKTFIHITKPVWHLLGWLVYLLYSNWVDIFYQEWDHIDYLLTFSYELVFIIVFYLFYSLIWSYVLTANRRLLLIIALPLGIAVFIALRYFIEEVCYPFLFGIDNYNDALGAWFYIRDNIWRGFIALIVSLIIFLIENRWIPEREKLKLTNELKEAELSFLRSQINPHFLFNMLSFLHTRAFAYDMELAEGIRKLSDILRYATVSSKGEKRLLSNEIDLLQNFISIYRLRFKGECFVDFKISGPVNGLRIESLLLLPFVENAFKHGVYNDPEHPIKIAIGVDGTQLSFTCVNKINTAHKDPGSGIGIENIKRRLDLQYPGKHNLQISKANNYYRTFLTLEL